MKDRFIAYGWQYIRVEDGNNLEEIAKALEEARKDMDRPTLIEVKTVIGYGAPNKAGKSDVNFINGPLKRTSTFQKMCINISKSW